MKTIQIILILLTILYSETFAQKHENSNFQIVELKQFYSGKGAIIPESFPLISEHTKNFTRFTPDLDEIVIAEKIFSKLIYVQYKNNPQLLISNIEKINNCNRQYMGYYNNNCSLVLYNKLTSKKQ